MSIPAAPPMEIFKDVMKNHYVDFAGRARRAEYWWFALITAIISFVGQVIAVVLSSVSETLGFVVLGLMGLFSLATFLPSLGLSFRRLHDTGRSGWHLLFVLIPFFGAVYLLITCFLDSDQAANKYGPSPKYGGSSSSGFSAGSGTLLS
jgi:uncharacterized membrane protein YhaH (DUF805 family)